MRFGAMRRQALAQALRSADRPADVALRAFFRAHPALGRRDRARIAESVFDVLRQRRLYERIAFGDGDGGGDGGAPLRRLREDASLDALLDLADARLEGRLEIPEQLPFAVRYSLPDWLAQALLAQFGAAEAPALAAALLEAAPLDLRANVAKADRAIVRRELDEAGIETRELPHSPNALRASGKPALERTAGYLAGRFEVQDAGSQLLAMLAAPRRSQTVIDLCAGAGGKTLAMAAAAAALVRPGGHLVYATCSLLAAENDEQRDAFESRHPGWVRCDPRPVLGGQGAKLHEQATLGDTLRLLPHRDDCDGFFAVRWRRGEAASEG